VSAAGRSRKSPPPFLLDTHVWFWYLTGSHRLQKTLVRAIDAAPGDVWLSPISLWELGMLAQRGRLRLYGGLRGWVEEAQRRFPLRDAPLDREVAVASLEVDLPHRDPADRFLAATALVHGLTLLTIDDRLVQAAWLPTRSG
jgi:PIN domain nuclease of toxin-antitoxin system